MVYREILPIKKSQSLRQKTITTTTQHATFFRTIFLKTKNRNWKNSLKFRLKLDSLSEINLFSTTKPLYYIFIKPSDADNLMDLKSIICMPGKRNQSLNIKYRAMAKPKDFSK